MKDLLVPISPGELLDKITILRIKSARMTDETKLRNVRVELDALEQTWRESGAAVPAVAADEAALKKNINMTLGSRLVEEKSYQSYR